MSSTTHLKFELNKIATALRSTSTQINRCLLAAAAMAKKKKARRSGRGETKEMEVQRTSSPLSSATFSSNYY